MRQSHSYIVRKLTILFPVLALFFNACVPGMNKNEVYRVSNGYMIDEYIAQNPELELCSKLIEMSTFGGMLHGYGSYTIFTPTNDAIHTYLAKLSLDSLSQLSQAQADSIIRYHVIRDSIKTTDMEDGRLPSPTISGRYLTDRAVSDSLGNYWIELNRQGYITAKNISCDNGIIHIVNSVLTPPTYDIMGGIESLIDSTFSVSKYLARTYSRFCTDSMSQADREAKWLTYLAQDNNSYLDLGVGITQEMIHNRQFSAIKDSLLIRLRKDQPTITNDKTLLTQYVDYHFINSLKYVSDLVYASSLESCVSNQSLSFKLIADKLYVNYFIIGSVIEPGVLLNRKSDFSDMACTNGVIHYIGGNIEIKTREAYRVYWDLAEQPEVQALKDFRKAGCSVSYLPGSLSELSWGGTSTNAVWYISEGLIKNDNTAWDKELMGKHQHIYGDMMRFRFSPTINSWFEWTLPLLVTGKYKVWLCWRREQNTTFRTVFKQSGRDDQVLPYVFDLYAYFPSGDAQALLDDGWKRYVAKEGTSGVMNCRLLGTIDVQSTGRHSLRFENLTGRSGETSWDMIQFIPLSEDQLWPRVDQRGKWCYENTPDCEIWPYLKKITSNYQGPEGYCWQ
jgi:uncharacterized surface protein with fasciclin (FAS1) repeats